MEWFMVTFQGVEVDSTYLISHVTTLLWTLTVSNHRTTSTHYIILLLLWKRL